MSQAILTKTMPMNIQTAYSGHGLPAMAVEEIRQKLHGANPKMVLFFASAKHDPDILSREMKTAFPHAAVFGCTTAGEIISGKMCNQSLVAMALDARVVQDVRIEVLQNLKLDVPGAVGRAFANFGAHFKTSMKDLDFSQYIGLVLVDGLSGVEEQLMDRVGDLTNVQFVGGSAGDDLAFEATHVFSEGRAYTNAAVLCIIKPGVAFDVLKTQSFKILKQGLVATKVNAAKRQVLEFNHQPAVEAYAKAVGTEPAGIGEHFMRHPLGLIAEGEPFVRSPQRSEGSSMLFYCNVLQDTPLSLLESGDIVQDTKQAIEQKQLSFGPLAGIVNFHCILRTLALQQNGQLDAYGKLFRDIPTIGFSTYGEQYLGHINQTSTMLLLGPPNGQNPH
jgi:hypothetical protein